VVRPQRLDRRALGLRGLDAARFFV
jgi:hypothetical protein